MQGFEGKVQFVWQVADLLRGDYKPAEYRGVILPLQLSHQMLGQLVGAQRPTVTLALGKLGERGHLVRRSDGHWFLSAGSRDVLQAAA